LALAALSASVQGVPTPLDDDDLVGSILALAGVRSWATFMERAKCVGLHVQDNKLTIMPHKKRSRPKGALQGIAGQSIVLPADATPEEIGQAIEEVFNRCE